MGAVFGLLLLFIPVIVYSVRKKQYDIPVLVPFMLALFFGSGFAGLLTNWLIGEGNFWVGLVGVWGFAMYKAIKA